MTFISDPNSLGVIDPEYGHALKPEFRDVPNDEEWFRFTFKDTEFTVKARCSWTEQAQKITYIFRVDQLINDFQFGRLRGAQRYEPNQQSFRADVLPALRDAIAAFVYRRIRVPAGRRLSVDVKFVG